MGGTPSARLRLSRSSRLKKKGDFARARARGQRVVCGCLIANALPQTKNPISRLGVVTSKHIGMAVVRARARRLLREVYRVHQHDLGQSVDLVLVARSSIVGKMFVDVERDFLRALRQLRLLRQAG